MLSFDFMLSLCTFLFLSSEFLFVVFGGISLQDDDDYSSSTSLLGQKKPGYHAPVALLNDIPQSTEQYDPFAEHRPPKIADREDEYKKHRRTMIISPERLDPFADGNSFPLFYKYSEIYLC